MHGIQLCDIQKRRHEAASNADHALISDMCKYVLVTSGGEAVRGQNELEQDGWHRSPCNGRCLTVDAQDHGGVFGQQTENQNMRMASTPKSDETIGGHAHFLALSLLAKKFRIDDKQTI